MGDALKDLFVLIAGFLMLLAFLALAGWLTWLIACGQGMP